MIALCEGFNRDAHRCPGPLLRCADRHGLQMLCRTCWRSWNMTPDRNRRRRHA